MFEAPVYVNDGKSCFRCCVASMTGEYVMDMPQGAKWPLVNYAPWLEWFDAYNYRLRKVKWRPRNKHYIAVYWYNRLDNIMHAVVEYNGKIVFNPDWKWEELGDRVGYFTLSRKGVKK